RSRLADQECASAGMATTSAAITPPEPSREKKVLAFGTLNTQHARTRCPGEIDHEVRRSAEHAWNHFLNRGLPNPKTGNSGQKRRTTTEREGVQKTSSAPRTTISSFVPHESPPSDKTAAAATSIGFTAQLRQCCFLDKPT